MIIVQHVTFLNCHSNSSSWSLYGSSLIIINQLNNLLHSSFVHGLQPHLGAAGVRITVEFDALRHVRADVAGQNATNSRDVNLVARRDHSWNPPTCFPQCMAGAAVPVFEIENSSSYMTWRTWLDHTWSPNYPTDTARWVGTISQIS